MIRWLEDTTETRASIIKACRWMNSSGINQGTSGNISVRTGGEAGQDMLITPSGIPYDDLTPDMIVRMSINEPPVVGDGLKPSSEWQFHQAILRAKPEMAAVVHAHPAHATAVAILNEPIPACHYMVAALGGNTVPLARYFRFGSEELSNEVCKVMEGHFGCIMANHGATVVGETLEKACWRLEELENLARMYLLARQNGTPTILSDEEMADVMLAFADYGLKKAN